MWLSIILILLIISNIYLNWSPTKPSGLISLNEYYQNVKQKGKFWELLQIASVPFIFLYNQVIGIFWLIKGFFLILNWIFQNLFVDGLWLVIRLLYHYFIFWPWKILRLAFEQIKISWKLSLYKIGVQGLFLTLLIAFFGRYLVLQYEYPVFLGYALSILSVFPFAMALTKISALRNIELGGAGHPNRNTTYYAAIFLLSGVVLTGINALLLYVGSFTIVAPAISALFTGGSIFISMLLIFNCIVIFFLLSVLPQHLIHENGDLKSLLLSLFKHLLNKWPQYILGAIASLLPAAILSIIPALLITGSVFVTNNIANVIFSSRIEAKSIQAKEATPPGQLSDWIDPDKTSNDSAMAIIKLYGIQKELELEKEALQINKSFITTELQKYSNPIGASPIFGVAGEAFAFYSGEQLAVNAKPAQTKGEAERATKDLNTTEKQDAAALRNLNNSLKSELDNSKAYISRLENELENVCVIKQTISGGESIQPSGESSGSVITKSDQCEERRKDIRAKIADQQEKNKYTEEKLSRLMKITSGIDLIHDHLKDVTYSRNLMFSISYLLLGIWICLIVALCCGFWIIVFGNLNYAIYHEEENDKKWHITSLFIEANSRNKNQPLLGLIFALLLPVLFVTFIGTCSFMNKFSPAKILKKLLTVEARIPMHEQAENGTEKTVTATIKFENSLPATSNAQSYVEDSIVAYYDSISTAQAVEGTEPISTPPTSQEQGSAPVGRTGIDANSYNVMVEKFSSAGAAEQSRSSYASRGIILRIITPGTFLGNFDQYYILSAGFDVTLTNAEQIKNQLNQKGVNCSIQKF